MALSIKGLNNAINKLNKLSNIQAQKIIEDVSKDLEKEIKNGASFSDEEKNYIGTCDIRNYGKSYFIDVGLANTTAPFEKWCGLWYQNWGYQNKGWNFGENGPYVKVHQLWFNEAVDRAGPTILKATKERIKKEISQALK